MIKSALKEQLHPRNRFRAGYDFRLLLAGSPALAAVVAPKALNQALLKHGYGLHTCLPNYFALPKDFLRNFTVSLPVPS